MQATQQTTAAEPPALATTNEAADFLRTSRSTIYEMIASGELESVKFRRCRRIRWADLYAIARGEG